MPRTPNSDLTAQQERVLDLMAHGHTNSEIAEALGITLDGAKYHVREVFDKLGVNSREQAVALWLAGRPSLLQRLRGMLWPVGAIAAGTVGLIGVIVALGVFLATGGDAGGGHKPVSLSNIPRLLVVDTANGEVDELTNGSEYVSGAAWSPDGTKIAVGLSLPESGRVAVLDPQTGDEVSQFSAGRAPIAPGVVWSPDGSQLAGLTTSLTEGIEPGQTILRVSTLATRDVRTLATFTNLNGHVDFSLAWSPDGRAIAVTAEHDAVVDPPRHDTVIDLAVVSVSSGEVQWLTSDEVAQADPTWSPDGQTIAFIARDLSRGMGSLEILPANGASGRTLLDDSLGALSLSWSPDGDSIALVTALERDPGRRTRLYVVDARNGNVSEPLLHDSIGAVWSPDGTSIAASSGDAIHLLDPSGGADRTLLSLPGSEFRDLAWSPDGKHLLVAASTAPGD